MKTISRRPLSRELILEAAIAIADGSGLGSLTMRRLGSELGVEAMSIYKHVAGKDEILDGILDMVVAGIDTPVPGTEWKAAMRARATSARSVLTRHPWAIGLLESRGNTSPTVLAYLDAIIGSFVAGGFSDEMAAHAFWVLDSFVYGHVIQETSLDSSRGTRERSEFTINNSDDEYPHISRIAALQSNGPVFDYETEFQFGLGLVIDALEVLRTKT